MSADRQEKNKIPVILDTDIGCDIDDTWALAFLLKSPELDLKLVLTGTEDTPTRAKIAAKILEIANQTQVPIGIGPSMGNEVLPQEPWVRNYDLASYPGVIYEDGINALIKTIMDSPEPITLISIGPVHNIRVALDLEPCIANRVRFIGMLGSIKRGYNGSENVSAEFNVAYNVEDSKKVLAAPWDITISPLDTAAMVRIKGEEYRRIYGSKEPLASALIENSKIWARNAGKHARDHEIDVENESSTLFDSVAVYLAFSRNFLKMERIGLRITEDGFTIIDKTAPRINCAMQWKDLDAFKDLIVERLSAK